MEEFACYISYPFPIPSCLCSAPQGIITPKILCQLPSSWVHPMRGTRMWRRKGEGQSIYSSLALPSATSPLAEVLPESEPFSPQSHSCQGSPPRASWLSSEDSSLWAVMVSPSLAVSSSFLLIPGVGVEGGVLTWAALSQLFHSTCTMNFLYHQILLLKYSEQVLFSHDWTLTNTNREMMFFLSSS